MSARLKAFLIMRHVLNLNCTMGFIKIQIIDIEL
jgi:hypothetical protein